MIGKLLAQIKGLNISVPIPVGQLLSNIPYSTRPGLGKVYKAQRDAIISFQKSTTEEKTSFVFGQFKKVFDYAYHNVPFYNWLYRREGLKPEDVRSFDDIKFVPIITKDDLLAVPLQERSSVSDKTLLVNTGGSSGKTLSFYMDPSRFGNEWAHIHYIWGHLGYKPSMLKLSFDGRVNLEDAIKYDFIRHSIRYNIYQDPEIAGKMLIKLLQYRPIYFLHGYPSAIYNFACYCESENTPLVNALRKSLMGVFLNSEFPSENYRSKIESVFNVHTQSFYGHTETCVMAYEGRQKFEFDVLQTYGFAEAVERGSNVHLIGTNYFNFNSPFIRYDTGDVIGNLGYYDKKLLSQFSIINGRVGDFIEDKVGNRIPLTGLIFGRHHELFNVCKHVQIGQKAPGRATVFYVLKPNVTLEKPIREYFDDSKVLVDFSFRERKAPILTKAGKVNLLVNEI